MCQHACSALSYRPDGRPVAAVATLRRPAASWPVTASVSLTPVCGNGVANLGTVITTSCLITPFSLHKPDWRPAALGANAVQWTALAIPPPNRPLGGGEALSRHQGVFWCRLGFLTRPQGGSYLSGSMPREKGNSVDGAWLGDLLDVCCRFGPGENVPALNIH
jgi:hypothetical protein